MELRFVGSIPASTVNFLFDISFKWGNEPNGEQVEQEQQQLKEFLGLWPMAADKNWLIEIKWDPLSIGRWDPL